MKWAKSWASFVGCQNVDTNEAVTEVRDYGCDLETPDRDKACNVFGVHPRIFVFITSLN